MPAVFHAMLAAIERRGVDLRGSALRLCICGGAVLPDRAAGSLGRRHRRRAAPGLRSHGSGARLPLQSRRPPNVRGTLGVPFPGVDVAIMPPADYPRRSATTATRRHCAMASAARSACAARTCRPATSRGAAGLPRRGDWLCTGDAGVRNADGTITLRRPAQADVHAQRLQHLSARDRARRARAARRDAPSRCGRSPNRRRRTTSLLRVTGSVTEDEVRAWCESRLSAYKQPVLIEIQTQ